MPDIDECETNIYLCGANAICNNNMGSYNCSCSPGYFGNGQACLGNCQILTHWVLLHFFFVVMSIIVLRFFLHKDVKKKNERNSVSTFRKYQDTIIKEWIQVLYSFIQI